jgi:hypothetical protein
MDLHLVWAVINSNEADIGAAVIAAALAGLGWVVKRWINNLEKLVNARGDNIEGQLVQVSTQLIITSDQVTAVQIKQAQICGVLGLEVDPPLVGAVPRVPRKKS